MQAIGIEKGKPFKPDAKTKALLSEAARTGGAMARANSFASTDPARLLLSGPQVAGRPGRHDIHLHARTASPQIDARIRLLHGAGNSPAMMAKNVGQGSQYLWTYKDATGNFLDGAKSYKLHVPPKVPAKDFWSVLVYDALSRSELQNGQPIPVGEQLHRPKHQRGRLGRHLLRPRTAEGQEKNWIQTVPGKGWFPIFRFYGPTEAYFDKTWKLEDIKPVEVSGAKSRPTMVQKSEEWLMFWRLSCLLAGALMAGITIPYQPAAQSTDQPGGTCRRLSRFAGRYSAWISRSNRIARQFGPRAAAPNA